MKHAIGCMVAACLLAAGQQVTLPFDLVDTLDGVKFKIRVPANWNGTLLLYMQGGKSTAPPPEPLVAPPTVDSPTPPLEATLLARGYALAASEIGTDDFQLKEEVQDTFALATFFRAKVGNPKRVILWGSSMGGLTALQLMEDYPRSFDAAIPMCAPAAGWSRRIDRNLDFALAYAATFGWPDEWGTLEDLKPGLLFARDVFPKFQLPAADGSNKGKWEFIRLVFGLDQDSLYGVCPLYKSPMYGMMMMTSTQWRENTQSFAAGRVAGNVGRQYTLTAEQKAYLAGLGVNADDLLMKMNARANIDTAPLARAYTVRYGDVSGRIRRPVLMMKNTADGQGEIRHESAYREAVTMWGREEWLQQIWVTGVGHCAFTSAQILKALGEVELWLDSGVKPNKTAFPATEGFDPAFNPPPWAN